MRTPNPLNPTNELAKERNRAAAERTLLAWVRRCLSLITFGVALDQIYTAVSQTFPHLTANISAKLTTSISLSFLVLGVSLMVLAIIQHYLTIKAIETEDYLNSAVQFLNLFITVSIFMFGVFSFIAVLIRVT